MSRFRPHRPSASMVVALLALFVAVGGTGYAALSLPKNSVGSKQIRKNAVIASKVKKDAITSTKIKDGSLLVGDFKAGQLPQGPQGLQGLQGPQGVQGQTGATGPGQAVAYARIDNTGNVLEANSKNIADANVVLEPTSIYCFKNLPFQFSTLQATIDNSTPNSAGDEIAQVTLGGSDCTATGVQAEVGTYSAASGPEVNQFFVVFY
jgi:hypothetical protein